MSTNDPNTSTQETDLAAREAALAAKEIAFQKRTESSKLVSQWVADGKVPGIYENGLIEFRAALAAEQSGELEFSLNDAPVKESKLAFFDRLMGSAGTAIHFGEVAGSEAPTFSTEDPKAIADAAIEFQAKKRAEGIEVDLIAAINHVTGEPKK